MADGTTKTTTTISEPMAKPVAPTEPFTYDETRPGSARTDLAKAEAELLGPDAPRNPDGTLLERGHGSRFATMPRHERIRLASLRVAAEADIVIGIAKSLGDAAAKLVTARKELADAAASPA